MVNAPTGSQAAILGRLREGPRQAQDVAADLGIDTSAARRHLENLVDLGYVASHEEIDGPGRPKKLYALTPAGRETFPRDYALLLQLVLAKVAERRDRRELEALVRDIAKDLAADVEGASSAERLRDLVRLYDKLGFDASVTGKDGSFLLRQRNCAFLRTAREDPALLCVCLDEGIVRAALPGARVELLASQARGAHVCQHRIELDA
jgi:predicted ArsR family transcriptional regulator